MDLSNGGQVFINRLNTHRLDGEELGEVGLRVPQEGAVSVGVVGEALGPLLAFGTTHQDPNLRCSNMIRKVLVGS